MRTVELLNRPGLSVNANRRVPKPQPSPNALFAVTYEVFKDGAWCAKKYEHECAAYVLETADTLRDLEQSQDTEPPLRNVQLVCPHCEAARSDGGADAHCYFCGTWRS